MDEESDGWRTLQSGWGIYNGDTVHGEGLFVAVDTPVSQAEAVHAVPFSDAAYKQLEALAAKHGMSVEEMASDALGTRMWLDKLLEDGAKVIVKERGQKSSILRRTW